MNCAVFPHWWIIIGASAIVSLGSAIAAVGLMRGRQLLVVIGMASFPVVFVTVFLRFVVAFVANCFGN